MTPTTEPAKRIAVLFKRKFTTSWSEKEIRTYKKLVKDKCFESLDDLELLERYYAFERRKGDKGFHRRDLCTFLNNYAGELDRAREWNLQYEVRRLNRRIVHEVLNRQGQKPVSDEEFKRLGDLAAAQLEEFRQQLRKSRCENGQ